MMIPNNQRIIMNSNQKTAVVTGGTSGLGEAATYALAKAGWRVLIVGRDITRGEQVARTAGNGAAFFAADLFSLTDVNRLGEALKGAAPKIDLLVNNAGGSFQKDQRTIDGLERTFALNVAAPFALTAALLPSLEAAKGRVLNITTGVPKRAKASIEELSGTKAGAGMQSYIRSKLAVISVTQEQAKRFAPHSVSSAALHPGIIPGTRFGGEMPKAMLAIGGFMTKLFGQATTLDEAAARFVQIGTGPIENGGYYKQGKLSPAPASLTDASFGKRLWAHLETITSKH
jgi:retinol dehydrogenase 14